jgi:hypothetical protein
METVQLHTTAEFDTKTFRLRQLTTRTRADRFADATLIHKSRITQDRDEIAVCRHLLGHREPVHRERSEAKREVCMNLGAAAGGLCRAEHSPARLAISSSPRGQ